MRLLVARHRKLHELAYSADGGTLFAVGSDPFIIDGEPFPEGALRGVDRWPLDDDGRSDPIRVHPGVPGGVARWLLPLPGGRLVLPGSIDTLQQPTSTAGVLDPTGRQLPTSLGIRCPGPWRSAAVSPDGESLVLAGFLDRGGRPGLIGYRLPASPGDKPVWTRDVAEPGDSGAAFLDTVLFAQDNERLLTLEQDRVPNEPPRYQWQQQISRVTRTFRWRSAADGRLLPTKGKPVILPGTTSKALLAAGGARLVVVYGRCLVSYDTAWPTKNSVRVESESTKHFTDIAVHPDGRRVFATCNDTTVREFDAVTLQEFKGFGWQIGRLRCVAIAPDGLTAAAGSDTGKVIAWDLE